MTASATPVVFLHVPKTDGTSVQMQLDEWSTTCSATAPRFPHPRPSTSTLTGPLPDRVRLRAPVDAWPAYWVQRTRIDIEPGSVSSVPGDPRRLGLAVAGVRIS